MDFVLDILTYFWWVLIIVISTWFCTATATSGEKVEQFFLGLGFGILLDLVIILLGPALHFLITVYFAGDYSGIETAEGLVIGASAIAGILVLGFTAWCIITAIGWDKKKEWDRICKATVFRVDTNGNMVNVKREFIYAKAIGNKVYYMTDLFNLIDNPYYGEDSERGKAKYKYDNCDWYVIF